MAVPESYIRADTTSVCNHISHKHRHIRRRQRQDVPSGDKDVGDEELDPRIQIELERLNKASEEINRLELELDDARTGFRQVLSDSTQCLNSLAKKLGTCVEKSRPYYDAKLRLREAQLESQKAVLMFERSGSMHEAAKDMVQLAEEGYKRRECSLAPTWQEMLNHATIKVNEAERERIESEEYHQRVTLKFKHTQEELHKLQMDLRKVISKSKVYFDMKAKFNEVLEEQKTSVSRLEGEVCSAKALYAQALCSLEAISDDIHRHRLEQGQKLLLGIREAGVGAESTLPLQDWAKGMVIEGSASPSVVDGESNEAPISLCQASQNMETVLDVNLLKLSRLKGMTYFEPATPRKASPQGRNPKDAILKPNPQDPVVFKTSLSDLQTISCSQTYLPVFNHHTHVDTVRIYGYQPAVESPKGKTQPYAEQKQIDDAEKSGSINQTPMRSSSPSEPSYGYQPAVESPKEKSPQYAKEKQSGDAEKSGSINQTPMISSSPSEPSLGIEGPSHNSDGTTSGPIKQSLSMSELSSLQDVELSHPGLSCSQDFLNTSQILQQQSFTSLSLSSLTSSPVSFELSASSAAHAGGLITDCRKIPPEVPQEGVKSIMTSSASQESSSPAALLAETSSVEHSDACAKPMFVQPCLVSFTLAKLPPMPDSNKILTTQIMQHSPTPVQHSPTPVQQSPTSVQQSPTSVQHSPTSVQHLPTSVQQSPTSVQHLPTHIQHPPTIIHNLPTPVEHSLIPIQKPATTNHNSPTTVQHSPTPIQNPPPPVQHPPKTIHNSPTRVQHPPTYVNHLPTTIHNSPTQTQLSPTSVQPSLFHYPPTQIHPSPFQLSPTSQPTPRKPAKLQGLILQVGTDGASFSANLSVHPSAYPHSQHNPKIMISTHHQMLGLFLDRPGHSLVSNSSPSSTNPPV